MKAKDVMTPNPVTCQVHEPIFKAVEVMSRQDTGVIPIVDKQNLCCGIITDRDVCLNVVLKNLDPKTTPLGEIMHTKLFTCQENDDMEDVLSQMKQRQVKRLVVTKDDRCIGIISEHDVALYGDKEVVGELAEAVYR